MSRVKKTLDYDSLKFYRATRGGFVCGFFTDGITVIEVAPKLFHPARVAKWQSAGFIRDLEDGGWHVEPVLPAGAG